MEAVVFYVAAAVRATVMLAMLPFIRSYLGAAGLLALSTALALTAAGATPDAALVSDSSSPSLVTIVVGEACIGLLAGLPLAITLAVLPLTGRLLDYLRGTQFGEQMNPGDDAPLTSLEQLGALVVLLLFFSTRAVELLVECWVRSLVVAPGAGLWAIAEISFTATGAPAAAFCQWVLSTALLLALPVAALSFCLDIGAAWVSRFLPRVNAVFELLPLKALLALGLVGVIFNDIELLRATISPRESVLDSFFITQK